MLSKFSATARQRALALLLGESHRLRSFPSESGLGLITFLQLSGIADLVSCGVGNRYGVAILGARGSSIVTVTRAPGQPAWIEAWGNEPAEPLFRHLQRWERLGAPGLGDLRLTISYGANAANRSWRTLRPAGSVVTMDWGL
jgi:hypothetical protein